MRTLELPHEFFNAFFTFESTFLKNLLVIFQPSITTFLNERPYFTSMDLFDELENMAANIEEDYDVEFEPDEENCEMAGNICLHLF